VDDEHFTAAATRLHDAAGEDQDESTIALTPALVDDISALWDSKPVQAVWARRAEFWVLDSADYYMRHVRRFADEAFSPTEEDLIMARAITTGIVETSYRDAGVDVTLVDVGGQRSERRKWIRCFDGVDALVFVSALTEYSQVLYEDAGKNRMRESLELFAEMVG
jgi:hypothetical protein